MCIYQVHQQQQQQHTYQKRNIKYKIRAKHTKHVHAYHM